MQGFLADPLVNFEPVDSEGLAAGVCPPPVGVGDPVEPDVTER